MLLDALCNTPEEPAPCDTFTEHILTCWTWCLLQDPAKAEQRRAAAEAALAAAQRSDKQLVTETRRFAGKDIQVGLGCCVLHMCAELPQCSACHVFAATRESLHM